MDEMTVGADAGTTSPVLPSPDAGSDDAVEPLKVEVGRDDADPLPSRSKSGVAIVIVGLARQRGP